MENSNRISPMVVQVIEEPTQFGPIVVNTMRCELSMAYNTYHLIYTYKSIDEIEEKVVDEMLFVEYTIGDCYNSTSYLPYVLDDAKNTCADLLKSTTDTNVIEKTIKQVFEDKLTLGYKVFILTNYNEGQLFKKVYNKLRLVKQFTYSVSNCKWKYSYQDVLTVSYTYKPVDENNGLLVFQITTTSEDYTTYEEVYTNTLCEYTLKDWIKNEEKIIFLLQKFNDYISQHPVRMKSLYCSDLLRKIPSIISEDGFNKENVNDDYIRNIVSKIKLEYSLL
jgi:hypothetical protein